jgi:hypothetical protein
MFSRLQALSPDLLLRSFIESSDPNHSKSSLRMAILNYNFVSNLYLTSVPSQPNTIISGIESMREMALLTPGDLETHWYDRFGSLRPSSSCRKFHAHSE